MSDVYYKKVNKNTSVEEVQKITKQLLDTIIQKQNIVLENEIPLKVHFGEAGNVTYIKQENYEGIIDYLEEKDIKTEYIETLVVYGGERYKRDVHIKLAKKHGFTRLPIIIADGDHGENFTEVEINKKHYKTCKIGKEFDKYSQILVLSHFKGHMMAGFGGAIKQLSMGHASKGGKLAMHMGVKPKIVNRKCVKCKECQKACNVDAITIGKKSYINHDKCVGCGGCSAVCPKKAISIFTVKGMYRAIFQPKIFREKVIEYAFAAQKGKNNIYINFAMNITKGCDCEPRALKPIMSDIGVFISTDPVAIDKACYDQVQEKGKKFRGSKQFDYAEKVGLGSTKYKLIEV